MFKKERIANSKVCRQKSTRSRGNHSQGSEAAQNNVARYEAGEMSRLRLGRVAAI